MRPEVKLYEFNSVFDFSRRSSLGVVLTLLTFSDRKVLKRTFNHDHSSIQTTCTTPYIAIRPCVDFWHMNAFI